jgi:Leucine-rich repeat (LRR) protein
MMTNTIETLTEWLIENQAIEYDMLPDDIRTINRLDLSGKSIDKLPENFGELSGLIALNLSNNLLDALPDSFSKLDNLVNLNLRRNNFVTLPQQIASLPLKSLNMNANKLTDISAIKSCETLHVIDLSANALNTIETLFEPLKHLRSLNLSYNYLSNIEFKATNDAIEILNISNNLLSSLNSSLTFLSDLHTLDASNNRISSIDATLGSLELEVLNLSSNAFQVLHFEGFEDLEELILDDNPYETLSFDSEAMSTLSYYSCEGCDLEEIIFPNSNYLQTLSFSSNALTSLSPELCQIESLIELSLDDNDIDSIPECFTNLKNLKTLYIDDNPIDASSRDFIMSLGLETCDINILPDITIRKAQFDDLRVMANLLSQLFSIESDFEINFDKQYNGLKLLFNKRSATMLVAKHRNNVVGMITMQRLVSTADGNYVGLVEDLIIDSEYRKMGIGSLLVESILEQAHTQGFSRVQLGADKENAKALSFYQKRGFNKTNLNIYRFSDTTIS